MNTCRFCNKDVYYKIMYGSPTKDKSFSPSGTETCKTHGKRGRQVVAKEKGGRPGVHTRAQRINVQPRPEKK